MKAFSGEFHDAVFNAFKDKLGELLVQIAPTWDLHHIKMSREYRQHLGQEEVMIVLILREGKFRRASSGPDLPRLD